MILQTKFTVAELYKKRTKGFSYNEEGVTLECHDDYECHDNETKGMMLKRNFPFYYVTECGV